jgi:hypothetical protein
MGMNWWDVVESGKSFELIELKIEKLLAQPSRLRRTPFVRGEYFWSIRESCVDVQ